MTDLLRVAIASLSSSRMRELLAGVGYGFDPVPRLYHDTFCDSDFAAHSADWEALYLDWWQAHSRITAVACTLTETQHRRRAASRAVEQRERQIA
jgi:hypothetical protein